MKRDSLYSIRKTMKSMQFNILTAIRQIALYLTNQLQNNQLHYNSTNRNAI